MGLVHLVGLILRFAGFFRSMWPRLFLKILSYTTMILEIHPFEYTNVSIIVPCSIIATSLLVPECNSPK